jgi:Asp-tRNA(Asn)/Glu-tRNA(Gln) amidotransferase A subunit family amidase
MGVLQVHDADELGEHSMLHRAVRVQHDGMPTALQIAAKPYEEATALQVGFAYEQSTDWHRKRPSIG